MILNLISLVSQPMCIEASMILSFSPFHLTVQDCIFIYSELGLVNYTLVFRKIL